MKHLQTATGLIAVREAGGGAPASALPLVLLHGIGATSRSWGGEPGHPGQIGALSQARRVVAWDAPGYGDSASVATDGVRAYAHALVALLDALALPTVALAASSWGSLIALAAAATQPSRISHVVLSGPSAGMGHLPDPERLAICEQRGARAQSLGIADFLAADAARLVAPDTGPQVMAELAASRQGVTLPGYLAALRMLTTTDGAALAARVHQPVLVLSGSADLIAPPAAHARRLAAAAPAATFESLAGCGHLPHLERADDFTRRVQAFIS